MEFIKYGEILVIKNAVSDCSYASIEKFLQENERRWAQSVVYLSGDSGNGRSQQTHDTRISMSLNINANADHEIDSVLYNIFNDALNLYKSTYTDMKISVYGDEGYSFLKYGVGGKFDLHVDDTAHLVRRISGLIYLNDDYEGGELDFPRQNVRIKPAKGDVVLFPSNFLFPHASLPITKGSKLAVTTWFK